MAKKSKVVTLPTHEEIVDYLQKTSGKKGKKDIARAFGVKGGDNRRALKDIIRNLESSGIIEKSTKSSITLVDGLDDIAEVEITGRDSGGHFIGRPRKFRGEEPPQIIITEVKKNLDDIEEGDLILAKLKFISKTLYEGEAIKHLKNEQNLIVGIFEANRKGRGGIIIPAERMGVSEFFVRGENAETARDGDLVQAEIITMRRGNNTAKIVKVLGEGEDTKNISLIAVYQKNIPHEFARDVIAEAKKVKDLPFDKHKDATKIPFVTIDGEDARDFDDAMYAAPDENPENKGGWQVSVAIADVAFYVKSGSLLDKEAYKRGNSTYFPDKAIPMLPHELSSDACSLLEGELRPCAIFHITIDKSGKIVTQGFQRAVIKSRARLNYNEVQKAFEGNFNSQTEKVKNELLNIYKAFKVLRKAREDRNALEIERDERRIIADSNGKILEISSRPFYDSHKAVEEFMVLANVCAARALEKKKAPAMYRVHEKPSPEKLYHFREFMSSLKIKIGKNQKIDNELFNDIIAEYSDKAESFVVNEMILRSQSQAYYGHENHGHSGLALESYVHFTSPIRRYSDLLVHRSLFDELSEQEKTDFHKLGKHISYTERRSTEAERDTSDRYLAYYLSDKLNQKFNVMISGLARAGLFVRIPEYGAEGFIPMRSIPGGFMVYDPDKQALLGTNGKISYKMGDSIKVKLVEIMPLTGGLIFEIIGSKK